MTKTLFSNIVEKPNGQLLKWIGNKYKYAEKITSYFPTEYNKYIEPFVGTGAVLATFAPHEGIAGDILTPLIDIWETLVTAPELLISHYRKNINKYYSDRQTVYKEIQSRYNEEPNALDLVLLSRCCYGGVIRFTKDGYISTPIGPHKPISPQSFEERVWAWRERVLHVKFFNKSFDEVMNLAEANDIIYCDPPYIDSQSILYGAQTFNFYDLIDKIIECKNKGAKIALSIDGKKKSGNKKIHLEIPSNLFEREIYLDCGSSMLKRLQSNGKTMLGEDVHDRLLLTW